MPITPCSCLAPLPGLPPIPIRRIRAYAQLSREAMDALFGRGSTLTVLRELAERPYFVANQQIRLCGVDGSTQRISVVGPIVAMTEVVLSPKVAEAVGLAPPARVPGDQDETDGGCLRGPSGDYHLDDGILVLWPHLVLPGPLAAASGIAEGDEVAVWLSGSASIVLPQVPCLLRDVRDPELRVDQDLAHRVQLSDGATATVLPRLSEPATPRIGGVHASLPVITEADVVRAHLAGKTLRAGQGTIITPAAQEADRRYHVLVPPPAGR